MLVFHDLCCMKMPFHVTKVITFPFYLIRFDKTFHESHCSEQKPECKLANFYIQPLNIPIHVLTLVHIPVAEYRLSGSGSFIKTAYRCCMRGCLERLRIRSSLGSYMTHDLDEAVKGFL